MLWELRWDRDGFSVEAAFKKRRKLDADHWYWDEPRDVPGSEFFYEAYHDLQTERPPDGPIPWSAAMAYADRKGLEPDIADALWIVVNGMDLAERRWRYEQQETGTGGG